MTSTVRVQATMGGDIPPTGRQPAGHRLASSDDVAVLDALLDGGADLEAPGAIFTDGAPLSDAVVFAQWNAAWVEGCVRARLPGNAEMAVSTWPAITSPRAFAARPPT